MKNLIVLILISFLLAGCIRKENTILLQPNTKVPFPYLYILTPISYPKTPFETYKKRIFNDHTIFLFRTIPNMMNEDITLSVITIINGDEEKYSYVNDLKILLENKTIDKEFTNRYLVDWEMSNHLERRVNYSKRYINFIGKLKCMENVESSNIADGVGSKNYNMRCPYYDKQGNNRYIHITGSMNFTFDRTKFEGSDNPSLVKYKLLDIEKQFKMDMKEILDSIEIYDMDKERMQKDELLYEKKYDIEAESKAKDLSFNCKFIKEANYKDDYWICIGKEINRECSKKLRVKDAKWECK